MILYGTGSAYGYWVINVSSLGNEGAAVIDDNAYLKTGIVI